MQLVVLGLVLLVATTVSAQEALRSSLAGEYAADAQRRSQENQYYNLRMGDLKLRFQGVVGIEASDNVTYSEKNPQADISLRPQLNITAMYPLTERNGLMLTIGAGYAKYSKVKERDHIFLTPDSRISFSVFAGDFVFDLHTQFTYTQEAYQQSEVYGGNYGYFENTTGVTATWDLNKLIFTFGLDHEVYSPTEKQYEYQGRTSEILSARGVFLLNPTTQLGLQAGFSTAEFDVKPTYTNILTLVIQGTNIYLVPVKLPVGLFLSNQRSVNLGPYFRSDLSPHLRLTASAGYAIYFQEFDSAFGKAGDSAAFYADLQLQHTVNARLAYNLNIGHQVRQGLTTDTLDYYYYRLNATWQLYENLTLLLPLSLETTTISRRNEEYQYWTLGLSANYTLSRKLMLTGGYNYRLRDSNIPNSSYTENQLVFSTRYSF